MESNPQYQLFRKEKNGEIELIESYRFFSQAKNRLYFLHDRYPDDDYYVFDNLNDTEFDFYTLTSY